MRVPEQTQRCNAFGGSPASRIPHYYLRHGHSMRSSHEKNLRHESSIIKPNRTDDQEEQEQPERKEDEEQVHTCGEQATEERSITCRGELRSAVSTHPSRCRQSRTSRILEPLQNYMN
jgi:hypothetical protein